MMRIFFLLTKITFPSILKSLKLSILKSIFVTEIILKKYSINHKQLRTSNEIKFAVLKGSAYICDKKAELLAAA